MSQLAIQWPSDDYCKPGLTRLEMLKPSGWPREEYSFSMGKAERDYRNKAAQPPKGGV